MLLTNRMYSPRTTCPKCASKIRLEDVRFTPTFPCPNCSAQVSVARLQEYKRLNGWLALTIGFALSYACTLKWWLALACWIPAMFVVGVVVAFLWSYAGKYLYPPRLELYVPHKPTREESSILHLDSD